MKTELLFGIIFTTIIILLLIAATFIVIVLASRQRTKQQADLVTARLAYEQELRTIQLETQEATRSHISAELHDNIGQMLTLTRLHIEKQLLLNPASGKSFTQVSEALHTATQQVRLLSHTLSTHFIADAGLLQTLLQEVQRLQALGQYTVRFEHDNTEPDIGKDRQIVVFRMIQEILSNSIKHSQATNIHIQLQAKPFFKLRIADDGTGFDQEAARGNSHGLGLRNIERRTAMAGLDCILETAPGAGCAYTITINNTEQHEKATL